MEQTADLAPESLSSETLENMCVADLESVMAQLTATAPVGLGSNPLHLGLLQTAYVQTLLDAKKGFDLVVANRLAAQFSMATGMPGLMAFEKYRDLGWDATLKVLLADHDFVPQMGPLCLWAENEGGWWVHDFGWADSPWAAAGYPPRAIASPASPLQGSTPWANEQTWVRWDSIPR